MPTYEYACRACGHSFDSVQPMADAPLTICPECGGELRKVFHPAGIAFKGSGFYATDNRKGAKSASAKAGAGSESGGGEGSSSGSDTASGKGPSEGGDSTPKTDGAKKDGAKTKDKPKDTTSSSKSSGEKAPS